MKVEIKNIYKKETKLKTIDDYLVKLNPFLKSCIWGGNKLQTLGKNLQGKIDIGETWELSTNSAGESTIADGKFQGLTLKKYIEIISKENCDLLNCEFPLLVKFIDAHDKLSIQVHPNNEYALKYENQLGKTEMWYIVSAEKDAYIYLGFNKNTTKKEVVERVDNGTLEEILNKVYVKPGQVFKIDSGVVHAIGKGCLICEIQQNSDLTYRLYDYNRVDKNGNKRELHISKALDVVNYSKFESDNTVKEIHTLQNNTKKQNLVDCEYFKTTKFEVSKDLTLSLNNRVFVAFVVLEGEGTISVKEVNNKITFKKGETFLGNAKEYKFEAKDKFIILEILA